MRTKYIPMIVMLVAGFVACIVTIINKYSISDSLLIVFLALLIFYIFGLIIRLIVVKCLTIKPLPDDIEEEVQKNVEESENTEEEKDNKESSTQEDTKE